MDFYLKRKERIILTAIEIISDLGFQGLSTKEICRRQDISDGTLYKHFKSKDEIILGILDYYSKFDESLIESIEINKLTPKESIRFFIGMLSEYYENYPAISAIISIKETLEHERNISERNRQIFEDRSKFIMQFIEKGKESGDIIRDVDSEALTDIILGAFREIILKWRISKFRFSLKERVLITLNLILKNF